MKNHGFPDQVREKMDESKRSENAEKCVQHPVINIINQLTLTLTSHLKIRENPTITHNNNDRNLSLSR